jgi:hypothetical protein
MAIPTPPAPGPSTDDDEHDSTVNITAAWHECLDWARRGDVTPLSDLLRGDCPLQDDWHVRTFLADVLDGKFKRPRGKPVRRPEGTFWVDAEGAVSWIDKRDLRRLEIAKWIDENKAVLGKNVFSSAADHFAIDEESLRTMMRRSSKAWQRSRST